MPIKFSERAIRAMSPITRERFYRQEKDELFERMATMTKDEIQEETKRLVRKWRV